MKKYLCVIFIFLCTNMIFASPKAFRFSVNNMEFEMSRPGAISAPDRYIPPEEKNPSLNYYMNIALWVGAKKGSDLFLVAGDGNSELAGFTEWKFTEKIQKSDSLSEKNITTIIYESQFDDRIPMPGHKPAGITVRQRTFELKEIPVIIYEYTFYSENPVDLLSAGLFFDFDIPEKDRTNNPENDQVFVDPVKRMVYMANQDDRENSPIPAVAILSDGQFNCAVRKKASAPLSDEEKWAILSGDHSYKNKTDFRDPADYRFIVHTTPAQLGYGDSLVFTVAMVHTFGDKSVNSVLDKLNKWYFDTPRLFKRSASPEIVDIELPQEFELSQNHPNPFNPSTRFEIHLPEASNIDISIFDLSGRLVRNIHHGHKPAGRHLFTWDGRDQEGRDVRSGIYFIEMKCKDFRKTRKVALIR